MKLGRSQQSHESGRRERLYQMNSLCSRLEAEYGSRTPRILQGPLLLELPRLTHHDTVVAAVPRRTYANAHVR
ncbi:protein phosphatase 2A regulatory subunit PR55 [Penicillium desertorum]|uniref:Protein phosphatase 2A regulatory subunit PR55 n=1 Tax=Penicillium desertorum TaxID=1303715 RepID=A0A9W9WHX9_9EURO|nr:protein phosphatase 2A regulatory subunit PR55 [Penicillium desertorum]